MRGTKAVLGWFTPKRFFLHAPVGHQLVLNPIQVGCHQMGRGPFYQLLNPRGVGNLCLAFLNKATFEVLNQCGPIGKGLVGGAETKLRHSSFENHVRYRNLVSLPVRGTDHEQGAVRFHNGVSVFPGGRSQSQHNDSAPAIPESSWQQAQTAECITTPKPLP